MTMRKTGRRCWTKKSTRQGSTSSKISITKITITESRFTNWARKWRACRDTTTVSSHQSTTSLNRTDINHIGFKSIQIPRNLLVASREKRTLLCIQMRNRIHTMLCRMEASYQAAICPIKAVRKRESEWFHTVKAWIGRCITIHKEPGRNVWMAWLIHYTTGRIWTTTCRKRPTILIIKCPWSTSPALYAAARMVVHKGGVAVAERTHNMHD